MLQCTLLFLKVPPNMNQTERSLGEIFNFSGVRIAQATESLRSFAYSF